MLAANAGDVATNTLNATLKGTYPFNETIIGATAPANGPSRPQTLAPGTVQGTLMLTNQGQWTFDGAGNMEANDAGLLVTTPGTGEAADVSASAASCGGAYTVNANNTVDMAYVGGLRGAQRSGGQSATATGLPTA